MGRTPKRRNPGREARNEVDEEVAAPMEVDEGIGWPSTQIAQATLVCVCVVVARSKRGTQTRSSRQMSAHREALSTKL